MTRISTAYQFDTYSGDIRRTSEAYFAAQRRVSSGKRIERMSDDPRGASLALSMKTLKKGMEGYVSNLNLAKGVLGTSEQALSEVGDMLKRANTMALAGANAATDQNGRAAMIQEVEAIQSRLVSIANSRGPSGQYIFAGQKNDAAPFVSTPTGLQYNGDHNDVAVETDPTSTMAVNTQGDPLFTDIYARLETLKANLASGNTGGLSGVSIADIQNSQKAVDAARGQVGIKLSTIGTMLDHYNRRTDELTTGISDIEDVDMSDAIVQYQQTMTAYQAALQVASKGYSLSLMDFIR